MKLTPLRIIFLTIAAAQLTGCGLQQSTPIPVQGHALHGSVYGGQQPVTQSSLQLYAAGTGGYGVGATYTSGTSLLKTPVSTDSNGFFTITGDYTCPSSSTLVYLVSTGGNSGVGTGTNSNLALMSALGPCGPLAAGTSFAFINMNEVTTVASVWALAPFMSGISNIGTSATNIQGLTNAFNNVNKLVNIGTGNASGPALPAGSTLPVNKINTLANILASCVNSAGGVAGDSNPCGRLFSDTTVNGVVPHDTVTAAMNLAQHPNLSTSDLYLLAIKTPPFGPTLSGVPADFALVISHSGGGIAAPAGVATDATGNVWIANAGTPNSVTELNPTGAPLSGAGGYTLSSLKKPSAIAIDLNGNAWVANSGAADVTRISGSDGTGTTISGGKLNAPFSLSIDGSNNVWVANQGDGSLTEINNNGTLTNYPGMGVSVPSAIAIDPQ